MALRKDLRILVADDMSVSRQILLQMLEQVGVVNVFSARDGQEAFETLEHALADVVIADLNMPRLDGLALLHRLRNDRRFFRIGYIMASGDDTDARIDSGWKLGMDRFLSKPFDIQRLVKCLESVAGRV